MSHTRLPSSFLDCGSQVSRNISSGPLPHPSLVVQTDERGASEHGLPLDITHELGLEATSSKSHTQSNEHKRQEEDMLLLAMLDAQQLFTTSWHCNTAQSYCEEAHSLPIRQETPFVS